MSDSVYERLIDLGYTRQEIDRGVVSSNFPKHYPTKYHRLWDKFILDKSLYNPDNIEGAAHQLDKALTLFAGWLSRQEKGPSHVSVDNNLMLKILRANHQLAVDWWAVNQFFKTFDLKRSKTLIHIGPKIMGFYTSFRIQTVVVLRPKTTMQESLTALQLDSANRIMIDQSSLLFGTTNLSISSMIDRTGTELTIRTMYTVPMAFDSGRAKPERYIERLWRDIVRKDPLPGYTGRRLI